ncbi:MAG: ferredoxin [Actinomycetia bacterium]|nr:ferredoxin [Actinomycetes bacterium]
MKINDEVCLGVGQCELLEPETFELDDDEGMSHVIGEGRLPRARAEIVVDRCPSSAISIPESGSDP